MPKNCNCDDSKLRCYREKALSGEREFEKYGLVTLGMECKFME